MAIAVIIAVKDEERHISGLITALLHQTRFLDEIVVVDDGSTDGTGDIVANLARRHSNIKYFFQENQGPAAARNRAWRMSNAEICVFTDGDCLPRSNWIEELVGPFSDETVGATAGGYETINRHSVLARFIGLEIAWKYSRIAGQISAHGTYNLAVRRSVLIEIGGFDEAYRYPSGEDWDLTYKISRKYTLFYVPSATVGHFHPQELWAYMKNQALRANDRINVYVNHPHMMKGDNYTPRYVAIQILGAGLLIPCLLLIFPVFRFSYLVPLFVSLSLLISTMVPFRYLFQNDPVVAFYGVFVQFCRCFAWALGVTMGLGRLVLQRRLPADASL